MFWDRYCEICKKQGVKPSKLAYELGMSRAGVNRWLNGAIPRKSMLEKIASSMEIPVAALIYDEYPYPEKLPETESPYPYNLYEAITERPYYGIIRDECMEQAVSTLTERAQDVIHMYYRDLLSQSKIGEKFGISGNRISQLRTRALRMLRHPSRMKMIKGKYATFEEVDEYAKSKLTKLEEQEEKLKIQTEELKKQSSQIIAEQIELENIIKCIRRNGRSLEDCAEQLEGLALHNIVIKNGMSDTLPIEELDFSARAYNCLKRAGIKTVGDIVATGIEGLMKVRNFGKLSYDEVIDKMAELGYRLPSYEEAEDV